MLDADQSGALDPDEAQMAAAILGGVLLQVRFESLFEALASRFERMRLTCASLLTEFGLILDSVLTAFGVAPCLLTLRLRLCLSFASVWPLFPLDLCLDFWSVSLLSRCGCFSKTSLCLGPFCLT